MLDSIMLGGYLAIALACLGSAAWLLNTVYENHLRSGFRPILSLWFLLAISNCLHYCVLAAYRIEHMLVAKEAASVLATPLSAVTTWIQAIGWTALLISFLTIGKRPDSFH